MFLKSNSRYVKTAVVLGILVSLGSMSSAHAGRKHSHETWVVHDVYIVDTRPPLVNTVPVATPAVAPARCDTSANTVALPSNNNYRTQHNFLVTDDGIATHQGAHPKTPSQQVQLNYYDE